MARMIRNLLGKGKRGSLGFGALLSIVVFVLRSPLIRKTLLYVLTLIGSFFGGVEAMRKDPEKPDLPRWRVFQRLHDYYKTSE